MDVETRATGAIEMPRYQFLTNHAQVLLCVAHDPGIRLRDIAETVGVTERSAHRIVSELVEDGYVVRERIGRRNAHRIVSELVEDGYVVRERIGRRNVYKVRPELPLRHPLTQETEQRRIGDLLEVLLGEDGGGSTATDEKQDPSRTIVSSI